MNNDKSKDGHDAASRKKIGVNVPSIQFAKPKKPRWKSLGFFLNAWYSVIGLVLLATGALDKLKDLSTSDYQKFAGKTKIEGLLIPQKIADTIRYFEIVRGRFHDHFEIGDVEDGASGVLPEMIPVKGGSPFLLNLLFKDHRIFVSRELMDLDGHYLGKVDVDTWKIQKKFVSDYFETDTSLEVVDDYNIVIFSMRFRPPNQIVIYGYDLGPNWLFLHSDGADLVMANQVGLRDSLLKYGNLIPRISNRVKEQNYFWYFISFAVLLFAPYAYYIWLRYLKDGSNKT